MDERILVRRDGAVATVTLNRPEKLNVWDAQMEVGLRQIMSQLSEDDAVRVIVLTGSGRAFCAGVDVEAMKDLVEGRRDISQPPPEVREAMGDGDFEQRYSYLLAVPKPVICALNGPAAGVGLVLALYCDIRYASTGARLASPFARRGLVLEHGIAWTLTRLIGLSRALEWMLSARTLEPQEAGAMGLVAAVIDGEGFQEAVAERAAAIARECSPRSLRIIKRQLLEAASGSLAQACKIAAEEVSVAIKTEDFREGVQHFLEKRSPRFTGRE